MTRIEEQRKFVEEAMRGYSAELAESDHNFFIDFGTKEDALGFREEVLQTGAWATWPYRRGDFYTVRIRKEAK